MDSKIDRKQTPEKWGERYSGQVVRSAWGSMRHAGPDSLAALEPLLRKVRQHSTLVERTPGSFYRRSKAYLRFHEDPSGTFADVELMVLSSHGCVRRRPKKKHIYSRSSRKVLGRSAED